MTLLTWSEERNHATEWGSSLGVVCSAVHVCGVDFVGDYASGLGKLEEFPVDGGTVSIAR